MILALGARGHEFDSRSAPFVLVQFISGSNVTWTSFTSFILETKISLPLQALYPRLMIHPFDKSGYQISSIGPTFDSKQNQRVHNVTILTSKHIAPLIEESDFIVARRAEFVIIRVNNQDMIGIINIYGYSNSKERSTLWEAINRPDLPRATGIPAEDFNMIIESLDDKIGGSKSIKMAPIE